MTGQGIYNSGVTTRPRHGGWLVMAAGGVFGQWPGPYAWLPDRVQAEQFAGELRRSPCLKIQWEDYHGGYTEVYPDRAAAERVKAGESVRVIRDEWDEGHDGTTGGVPVTTPDEAVEAASRAISDEMFDAAHGDDETRFEASAAELAEVAIEAAGPIIAAAVRAQVAGEREEQMRQVGSVSRMIERDLIVRIMQSPEYALRVQQAMLAQRFTDDEGDTIDRPMSSGHAAVAPVHALAVLREMLAAGSVVPAEPARCVCGKPAAHVNTDQDGVDWPCRVPVVPTETTEPEMIDDDGIAWWEGPVDLRADATGGSRVPATITLRRRGIEFELDVSAARTLVGHLLGAIAHCEAAEPGGPSWEPVIAELLTRIGRLDAEVARYRAITEAARHPHKGPNDTDATMLVAAAERAETGYVVGGSHTSAMVGRVLRAVAAVLGDGE